MLCSKQVKSDFSLSQRKLAKCVRSFRVAATWHMMCISLPHKNETWRCGISSCDIEAGRPLLLAKPLWTVAHSQKLGRKFGILSVLMFKPNKMTRREKKEKKKKRKKRKARKVTSASKPSKSSKRRNVPFHVDSCTKRTNKVHLLPSITNVWVTVKWRNGLLFFRLGEKVPWRESKFETFTVS